MWDLIIWKPRSLRLFSSVTIDTGLTSVIWNRIFVPYPRIFWFSVQTVFLTTQGLTSVGNFSFHFRYHLGHSGGIGVECWALLEKERLAGQVWSLGAVWSLLACEVIGVFKFWPSTHWSVKLYLPPPPINCLLSPVFWGEDTCLLGNRQHRGSICPTGLCVYKQLQHEAVWR